MLMAALTVLHELLAAKPSSETACAPQHLPTSLGRVSSLFLELLLYDYGSLIFDYILLKHRYLFVHSSFLPDATYEYQLRRTLP